MTTEPEAPSLAPTHSMRTGPGRCLEGLLVPSGKAVTANWPLASIPQVGKMETPAKVAKCQTHRN